MLPCVIVSVKYSQHIFTNLVFKFTGNKYHLLTRDAYDANVYRKNVISPREKSFVFGVKACNDAHLALTAIAGDPTQKTYEIVIGGYGNTRSEIRDGMQVGLKSIHGN